MLDAASALQTKQSIPPHTVVQGATQSLFSSDRRAWTRFFRGALSTGSAAKHEDNSVSSLLTFAVAISGRACVVNLSAYPSLVQLVHLFALLLFLGYFFPQKNNKPISATEVCFVCPSDLCLTKIILSTLVEYL